MKNLLQKKSKYIQVAELIRDSIRSEHLRPGDRVQNMRSLASRLKFSLKSVQYGFDLLEAEGLIERRPGSGTFVKRNLSEESRIVKLLLPVADMSVTPSFVQSSFSDYQNGIIADMPKSNSTSMELIAISKSNRYGDINNNALNNIHKEDKLIIDGSWFVPIMDYVAEKNCEVVYFSDDYLAPKYDKLVTKWHCFYYSIPESFEKITMHLVHRGYKKIVLCKPYHKDEAEQPLQYSVVKSYKQALAVHGLLWKESFYTPFSRDTPGDILSGDKLRNYISDLWKRTKFDAIITHGLIDIPSLLDTLKNDLGLKVPEDVGIVNWGDYPELAYYSTPITTLKLPAFEMSKAASNILLSAEEQPSTTLFSTRLDVRASTMR